MKKVLLSLFALCTVCILASFLYVRALHQETYLGLPTVPCIDDTKPIVMAYSLHIAITILGKLYPLSQSIGHDYGNCLRDIYTTDPSGTVHVKANEHDQFSLGNFFDVWHATFNSQQIFGYRISTTKTIEVFLNGKRVEDYRNIPLQKDAYIEIMYN